MIDGFPVECVNNMGHANTECAEKHPRIADLTKTELHDLLAAERRHLVLEVLTDQSSSIAFEELVAEVATREDGLNAGDEEAKKHVEISLHRVHLPKMDSVDVLDYDPESRLIEL